MSDENTTGNHGDAPAPATEPVEPAPPIEPTSDDKTMAMLAHLLGIITWFLGALIIWLIKKDQSPFVNDQGKEALNFQITITIAYVAAGVLTCVTFGLGSPLTLGAWLANLIFCILAGVAANKGERYRYPVCIRLVT